MAVESNVLDMLELQDQFLEACSNGDGVPDINRLVRGSSLETRVRCALSREIRQLGSLGVSNGEEDEWVSWIGENRIIVPTPGFRMGEGAAGGINLDSLLRFNPKMPEPGRDVCSRAELVVVTAPILDAHLTGATEVAEALEIPPDRLAVAGVWDTCKASRPDFGAPVVSVFPVEGSN